MSERKDTARRPAPPGTDGLSDTAVRRLKFGAASDGWEAYASWLDQVRQRPGRTSRQAVVSKALYSVSSYKNWADKARGAFDDNK
jgi:hypothetical protein